jgi:hypothetical protein
MTNGSVAWPGYCRVIRDSRNTGTIKVLILLRWYMCDDISSHNRRRNTGSNPGHWEKVPRIGESRIKPMNLKVPFTLGEGTCLSVGRYLRVDYQF